MFKKKKDLNTKLNKFRAFFELDDINLIILQITVREESQMISNKRFILNIDVRY